MDSVVVSKVDGAVVEDVVSSIVKAVSPLKIILFGSWVYGKPHKGSDLDILVVVDDKTPSKYDVSVKCYKALRGVLMPKDVIVATPKMIEDWSDVKQAFITSIVRNGRVIYERG